MTQKCLHDKPQSLRLLPISAQPWRQELGKTFRVVFLDGRTVRARFLGMTTAGFMLYRSRIDDALLLSMTRWDGKPSRKILVYAGGKERR